MSELLFIALCKLFIYYFFYFKGVERICFGAIISVSDSPQTHQVRWHRVHWSLLYSKNIYWDVWSCLHISMCVWECSRKIEVTEVSLWCKDKLLTKSPHFLKHYQKYIIVLWTQDDLASLLPFNSLVPEEYI